MEGHPLAELCVRTSPTDHPMVRLDQSESEISEFLLSIPRPYLVVIEDFAFAGRFSSYDIAMHAARIRKLVWDHLSPTLLVPPSSLKGWLSEEGVDVRVRDKKAPAIEWVSTNMGYESKYRRKGDYNHTFDAAVLASMGRMGYRIHHLGEAVGTPRQRDIFVTHLLNSKGQPKGLFLRPELYYTKGPEQ